MIDHTGISVSDFEKAKSFYDQALASLGVLPLYTISPEETGDEKVVGYARDKASPSFWLNDGAAQVPPLHIAFSADNRAQVDAFYAAALAGGGTDNGAPGLRPIYHEDYYGAFVLDMDGNNIEAVCHLPEIKS